MADRWGAGHAELIDGKSGLGFAGVWGASSGRAGPLVKMGSRERRYAAAASVLGILVFCVAAALNPYTPQGEPRSHGTHTQLGLPPCTMKAMTGLSCPGCGMTTTFSLVVRGDIAHALQVNWAGVVVACVAAVSSVSLGLIAITGWRLRQAPVDTILRNAALVCVVPAVVRYGVVVVLACLP